MVKKIALIGASDNPAKFGNIILRDLLAKGFEVLPVNPRRRSIENRPCYATVTDLPSDTELLVFVVPPSTGLAIARESLAAGFRTLWFQPGAGSRDIGEFCESQPGVLLVMDRCIMVETARSGRI